MSEIPEARPIPAALPDVATNNVPPAAPPESPRLWVLLLQFLAALLLSFIGQIVLGVIIGFSIGFAHGASGQDLENLPEEFQVTISSPAGMLAILLISQASFALVIWLVTWRHRGTRRIRLGMVPARITAPQYIPLAMGTFPVALCGLILAGLAAQLRPPDDTLNELWRNLTPGMAVTFVLAVSLVPGIVEEAFFRGHLQRRLLLRWPPAAAIAATSLLFAIAHLNLVQGLFVLPLGIWLGIIAWRTGSIWPGALCHAAMNGAWNLFNIMLAQSKLRPDSTVLQLSICGVAVASLLALVASIILLVRIGPPPRPDAVLAPAPTAGSAGADYSI